MHESSPWTYALHPGLAVLSAIGYYAMFLCPLVTFLRLRKLAVQIGQVRLARLATIVAIGDAVSISAACVLPVARFNPFGSIESFSGSLAFLIPQVALLVFALGTLYVLFEMAGHFFNLARPRRDRTEFWFGPKPVRT
jgi:hypothetical protein